MVAPKDIFLSETQVTALIRESVADEESFAASQNLPLLPFFLTHFRPRLLHNSHTVP
jgi:hypothetical protein